MATKTARLTAAVEDYLTDLHRIRASGSATGERSRYGPLANLLNAVGGALKPKVFCVGELADQGAGHPDFGLYSSRQVQRGQPRPGQAPERGVVEVKPLDDDAWLTAHSRQVSRYWDRYGLVLVTNTRDFVLLGEDSARLPAKLETFRLAESAEEFEQRLETPRAFARDVGAGLAEYLGRALAHRATLSEPRDLAWLLASYARDGLARVEAAGDAPPLKAVRSALEEALGVRFEGPRGEAFFRSTLVQTLFYGLFSAWVLWARQARQGDSFDWRTSVWHLRAPVLRALFHQLSGPARLQRLDLVEVMNWTAAALDRVDRPAFFSRFNEGEAVPYFYEPFLQAFDPGLRKQLGVWYTPSEVVRYMVARVDRALRDDLGIADGLAADNVYVLDPCCGTGAYLAEVLRRIAANLQGRGLGALAGARVKQAALERVFGFEIMPAPFVVAHLQVGLTLQDLDAPLAEDGEERAGVFLTNALTGWEPKTDKPLPFPELEEERDRAERVKRDTPILVILGNPPYNGFAGMAVEEERELSEAYRTTRRVRRPEGQGLNDPYVRFFRMAERRIAERTGQGVVCFISNYSWLDGLSFTGMRERYLEAFDAIRIDCLNGDKRKTGKVAPDGSPDPSIFSTEGDPVGIQVGTAIVTLVRKADHAPAEEVGFRHLWGQAKPAELTATAETEPGELYEGVQPVLPLGLPFVRTAVSEDWFDWPALPELFPVSFPGVQTGRDTFLVDTDLSRLKARIEDYFDADLTHEEIARRYPRIMKDTARFNARRVRETLLARGGPDESRYVRYAYRPFDNRWLYWESETKLLREKSPRYPGHVFVGNMWLVAQQKPRREWSAPQVISNIGCLDLMDRSATCIPGYLLDGGLGVADSQVHRRPNLTGAAQRYLHRLGAEVDDLFHHVLIALHDPTYRQANAGALRMEWPRIPLPGWPDGNTAGAAESLAASAGRGRELARLLDPDTPVPGVTQGTLRPELAAITVPSTADGRNMTGDDFSLTAGWGHFGTGDSVMPGQGRIVEREYTPDERAALGDAIPTLGARTLDVYLNDRALWRNVPAAVWDYRLGGYQVLKKWLSYRERDVLGRILSPKEVQHFGDIGRRIARVLRLSGVG
ncbi:MAG: N-6 DNA methylase [Gemmatimonadaceae bacterium]|nr:N-6 DNA methylase [Gemmatimonadaceae bacterium]